MGAFDGIQYLSVPRVRRFHLTSTGLTLRGLGIIEEVPPIRSPMPKLVVSSPGAPDVYSDSAKFVSTLSFYAFERGW